MTKQRFLTLLASVLFVSSLAWADGTTVNMSMTVLSGTGQAIGTITVEDTPYGALFSPALKGLAPGLRGFHVHEHGNCGPKTKDGKVVPGLAAGGHYDPTGSSRHEGPYGKGHLGDLPPLYVDEKGASTQQVLAPRLKVADIRGRSLMVHAGGDNFSDLPKKLGGGGPRKACGVVP